MPQFANAIALPATNDGGRLGGWSGVGQLVFYSPAPDLCPVDFEIEPTQHLTGGKAVGGGRNAVEACAQEGFDLNGPVLGVISTRAFGYPGLIPCQARG